MPVCMYFLCLFLFWLFVFLFVLFNPGPCFYFTFISTPLSPHLSFRYLQLFFDGMCIQVSGEVRGSGMTWGNGNHNRNILYKNLYSMKKEFHQIKVSIGVSLVKMGCLKFYDILLLPRTYAGLMSLSRH